MKQFLCFFCMCVGFSSLGHAQLLQRSTLGMSGSSNQTAVGYISASVAQYGVIGTYKTQTAETRQGFQQPPIGVTAYTQSPSSLEVSVFPNPFVSEVTLLFKEEPKSPVQILLWDVLGREVIRSEYPPALRIPLKLHSLATGQYILRLSTGSQEHTVKLLKN